MSGRTRIARIFNPGSRPATLKSVLLPRIDPMRLGRSARSFNDPAWLYELKWDGFGRCCKKEHAI